MRFVHRSLFVCSYPVLSPASGCVLLNEIIAQLHLGIVYIFTDGMFFIFATNQKNANIVVAPSDHLILKEDEFLAAIEKGLDFVSRSEKLLTLGIKPNRPETGYGYIQIDEPAGENFYKVKTFTEKPELELAKVFVESGEFYWNSGLFMWNVNTIIKASEDLLPELASKLAPGKDIYATDKEKAFIEENFPACPNVSIDFGIMEKADNVYVSLGDFGWSDLGTWGSLYDLSERDPEGNVTLKCQ